jgi:exodeoxyribonuclease VII large subunit
VSPDRAAPTLWDDPTEPTWSVSEIGEAIGGAIRRAFPDELWLRGEIRNLKRGARMVWLDLVEPVPGADLGRPPRATLPVVLFEVERRRVNAALQQAGGAVRMEDGTEVRIRGRVNWWGPGARLQLQMTDIDPAFTLGRLAADRQRVLRQLDAEGLLTRQQSLPLPLVPLRVGLVTSAGSAAEHDVLDELRASGIGFRVRRADTRVQGQSAARSVAAALQRVATGGYGAAGGLGATHRGATGGDPGAASGDALVDVVLLVRGGGSATDLSAFDSEVIARAVALSPVPVLTGIGHDVDRTVADEVAHASYKTPTACAQAVVRTVRDFDMLLAGRWEQVAAAARGTIARQATRLRNCARHVSLGTRHGLAAADSELTRAAERLGRGAGAALDRSTRTLERATGRVESSARVHVQAQQRRLDGLQQRLVRTAPRLLDQGMRQLDGIDVQVRAFDPARTLARGWSITRRAGDGSLVRSPGDVDAGDEIVTTVATGQVVSTVRSVADPVEAGDAHPPPPPSPDSDDDPSSTEPAR